MRVWLRSHPFLITRIYELVFDLFVCVAGNYPSDAIIMKHPLINIHHPTVSFLKDIKMTSENCVFSILLALCSIVLGCMDNLMSC